MSLSPDERVELATDKPVDFYWTLIADAAIYRLEVEDLQSTQIISAILTGATSGYRAPPWFREKVGDATVRWRVTALDEQGKQLAQTNWRLLRMTKR